MTAFGKLDARDAVMLLRILQGYVLQQSIIVLSLLSLTMLTEQYN